MDRKPDKGAPGSLNGLILCINNCGFFGSKTTNSLCSKCYKDYIKTQPNKIPVDKEEAFVEKVGETSSGKTETRANKCWLCRKRIGLTGFKCKCGHMFCSVHKYSDKHNCVFDYKGAGQEAIAKANPVVKADKVEKI